MSDNMMPELTLNPTEAAQEAVPELTLTPEAPTAWCRWSRPIRAN